MENKVKSHYLNVLEKDQQEMVTMVQLFDKAERSGLVIEVIYSALNNMKEFPDSSPLLCMQIALEDWDV